MLFCGFCSLRSTPERECARVSGLWKTLPLQIDSSETNLYSSSVMNLYPIPRFQSDLVVVIRDAIGFRVRVAVCVRPCVGFRASAWVAGSHKLWKSGVDVFLSTDGETFKELKAADYIPVGATLNVDGIKCRIEAVDFAADEVRLTNIEDKNRPIRFSESIQYVLSLIHIRCV